ncbi:NAD(P)/FAD-dependent oxidoreductase [Streptococcus iniae]|uniref:Pyridine nucleotide-disulfide oxidoreductase n=1 Tax=Streptococcus iniae TaxID=1346 RepID=A0A3L8GJ40_STRIN|nr:NAD(P)/FAD-dependent oxidoreductase [Streptococcus iniae]AGM99123.1 pyridine nucleotide-disulfide oxidoreductase [Streptococcus iniae SF1]AHY16066.1 pyridine nucleotide-disulfide oxidoreductase [Streptococcus iniae]AHY17930.1 pyridine nucleotide-disulfide oxidoreductase [Streptococcus iniae]AJG26224.1 pyridine nucleotide-disulfide oxidoreductase [Streptococcus iniae]ASL35052.1 putative oxidoreductase CzcO [Streptococcus iniae]
MKTYNIIIIGAGAAGIGFGASLKTVGIEDFLILEKGEIGDSFLKWPTTTQFITPSFTSNGFGFPDLNAVVPDTSPAFTFEKEHVTGKEYAEYLQLVASHYQLPIKTKTNVCDITKQDDKFLIKTQTDTYLANYLIMATGEFQYPNKSQIAGSELGIHYGEVEHFHVTSEDPFIVIGGNESACDALSHLAYLGNDVHLFTETFGQKENNPDPSISLSPITKERLKHLQSNPKYHLSITENKKAISIEKIKDLYHVTFQDGTCANSKHKPILATGFLNTCHLIGGMELFCYDDNHLPLVTEQDESTKVANCFLIGPSLRHGDTIFCYIYKFRQRFMPLICEIAKREKLKLPQEEINFFKANQMYLEDLDCCSVNCDC